MINNLSSRNEQFLANMDRIQARIDKANAQVSSGLRITSASDAPDEVGPLLQSRAELAVAEQSKSNLNRVKGEVDSAENALQSVVKLAERARVLGAQGLTGTQTAATRASIAAELGEFFVRSLGRPTLTSTADSCLPATTTKSSLSLSILVSLTALSRTPELPPLARFPIPTACSFPSRGAAKTFSPRRLLPKISLARSTRCAARSWPTMKRP